jgi:hypothetical protein
MALPKWVRLQGDYPCPLRRGAWYRVVNASPLEIVVDVNKKPVRIPRRHLELADQPAQVWTVVELAQVSPRAPRTLGARYAVCPSCRERVALEGKPVNLRCPKCNGMFNVAWIGTAPASPVMQSAPPPGERRPRLSTPTVPRKRGPDRRKGQRRVETRPVDKERRSGSDRRGSAERRKGRPPRGPSPG